MKKFCIGMPVLMEFNTIEENIIFAVQHHFDFVELNMNFLYCYPNEKIRETLNNAKELHGLDFSFHYYDNVDISSPNINYFNYLKADMKLIGDTFQGLISKIVLHIEPGSFMTIFSEKHYVYKYDVSYVKRTIDNLMILKSILDDYNIDIVLENVPIHPYMESLYKALGKYKFSFTWDIGHDVIYEHYLFSRFRTKFSLNIKHMHMHNVLEKSDHQRLDLGKLSIKEYLKYVVKHNISCVVEVKDAENLKSSKLYLETLIESIDTNHLQVHIITPE